MVERRTPARILLISEPPRHGKSQHVSHWLPVWHALRWPDEYVGVASYSSDFAKDWGRQSRDSFAAAAPLYGMRLDRRRDASDHWGPAGHAGGMRTGGVRSGWSGRGFKCFPAGTMVATEIGGVPIETLYAMKERPRVLSYCHRTNKIMWQRIIAAKATLSNELLEIATRAGRRLRATADHLVYVDGVGYRRADELRIGDRLVAAQSGSYVRYLRQVQERWQRRLPQLRQPAASSRASLEVRVLRQGISAKGVRVPQDAQAGPRGRILRQGMLARPSRGKECGKLSAMRRTHARAVDAKVLQPRLFAGVPAAQCDDSLRVVRSVVYAPRRPHSLLLAGMRQRGALAAHARRGKFSLQTGRQLFPLFSANAANHLRSRPQDVRGVLGARANQAGYSRYGHTGANQPHHSPLRRKPAKQHARESRDGLRHLPCDYPQVESDAVAMVRRIRCGSIATYDLQIESTRNFFAQGILVHNCLILDDLLKDDEEALSENHCEKLWNWFKSTARSRLTPDGVIVVMATRWTQQDITGRILAGDLGPEWPFVHVNLPAIAEAGDQLGRQPGEALWPERWPEEILRTYREGDGSDDFWWQALYQQRPTQHLHAEWPEVYFEDIDADRWPDPYEFELSAIAVDAAKGGATGDYSAIVFAGLYNGRIYVTADIRRRPCPELIADAAEMAGALRPEEVGFESNGFQELLAGDFEDYQENHGGFPYVVERIQNYSVEKRTRIRRLGGYLGKRRLRFNRGVPGVELLIKQLKAFPKGDYDDGPDALEMAVRRLNVMAGERMEFEPEAAYD
ncbi:MAG: hypothetical protein H0T51_15175 [Pirellulales bacterium]|nr:hypothetical protein [Pirellulales bacterium]